MLWIEAFRNMSLCDYAGLPGLRSPRSHITLKNAQRTTCLIGGEMKLRLSFQHELARMKSAKVVQSIKEQKKGLLLGSTQLC